MTRLSSGRTVLVVDDAPDTLEVVRRNLSNAGYNVIALASAQEALSALSEQPVDLVVTDFKMPGTSGMDLVRHVRDNLPGTEVMMITGYATIDGAVEAIKAGAEEYLAKPFTDEELLEAVGRALEKRDHRQAMAGPPRNSTGMEFGLIGSSPAMQEVYSSIERAAETSATVLITGESGTGKELVARAIHYSGPRAASAFVPVNCGGIPDSLIESELFGHVKGAFTGAQDSRAGFFQTADSGTVFLDEIGETPASMQVKLLRVLQDGEVCMLGSNRPFKVDVRVVAATNKDLPALIGKGSFREDLYYRLNVIGIDMPALRDRGDDVLALASAFAERFAADLDRPVPRFSDRAMQTLRAYYWPGNVRELQNVIQRLVIMSGDQEIDSSDLPELMRFSALSSDHALRSLAEVESEHVLRVLEAVGHNKTRAAEILGIDRKTLREKLKKRTEP